MPVYQLDISARPGVVKTGQTGSMSDPATMTQATDEDKAKVQAATQDVISQGSQTEQNTAASMEPDTGENPEAADRTIVVDGSLSEAYTKALAVVYAKDNTATESQVNDTALIVAATVAKKEEANERPVDLYIYATDADEVENSNVAETYDKLRLALDNDKVKDVVVAVENVRTLSPKLVALEDYLRANNVKVYHTRTGALAAATSLIGLMYA